MITYEYEMIPLLSEYRRILGTFKFEVTELSSGQGVADMVFYNLKKGIPERSLSEELIPNDTLRVLTQLKELSGSFDIAVLHDKIGKVAKKQNVVEYLISNGFLEELDNNQFRKIKEYEVGFSEVVAIEAKLKDWKRGLYQARRYRGYANKSYLAVYSPYIHRAQQNIEQFKKYNVGLIEVKEDGLVIHHEPTRERAKYNLTSAVAFQNALSTAQA